MIAMTIAQAGKLHWDNLGQFNTAGLLRSLTAKLTKTL